MTTLLRTSTTLLLLITRQAPALAQDGVPANPAVSFAPVAGLPIPLQSTSGRFSSLHPPNQTICPVERLVGRVVAPNLLSIKVTDRLCNLAESLYLMLNVEFADPADIRQMIAGRRLVIAGKFKTAHEYRDSRFNAEFLIVEKAKLAAGDPRAAPTPPFTSYLLCQPPELDAFANRLGHELCVQNTILPDPQMRPALEAAALAASKDAPEGAGPGEPEAITCRPDSGVSDRHLPAIACARNSYWAWYRKKWLDPLLPTPAPP